MLLVYSRCRDLIVHAGEQADSLQSDLVEVIADDVPDVFASPEVQLDHCCEAVTVL